MKRALFVLLLLAPSVAVAWEPFAGEMPQVKEGNQAFGDGHFEQALERYENAEQELAREPRIHYNRGDALVKLGRTKEAREAYLRALGTDDVDLKKRNYYNIGNTFFGEGALPDAMAYYRRALDLDPSFEDARYNLELAIQAQKQQKQQNQGKQNDDKNQDQKQDQKKDESKDPQQDQKNQDQQKQDQEKQDQQKQDQQKQDQEKQDQQKQDQQKQEQEQQQKDQTPQEKQQAQASAGQQKDKPDPGKFSKEQAVDLLDAMRENEKPFQMQRFMIPEFKNRKVEKDW